MLPLVGPTNLPIDSVFVYLPHLPNLQIHERGSSPHLLCATTVWRPSSTPIQYNQKVRRHETHLVVSKLHSFYILFLSGGDFGLSIPLSLLMAFLFLDQGMHVL